jgi:hypothetical protein
VLQEYALKAESEKCALVRVFGLEASLVFLGGLFLGTLEFDIFGVETILESEEGEQMEVHPLDGRIAPGKHDVQADFVLGEIPVIKFLVYGVAFVNFDIVVGVAVENFTTDKTEPDSACVQSK